MRLASWLLYLRACCCSSEGDNAGSSSTQPASHLWCSYISLLQACGDMTAACTGAWRDVELQQLEPPVLKVGGRLNTLRGSHHTLNRQPSKTRLMVEKH